MPTYQYTCTDCGQPLEVVQSFSDDALTECPACGGRLRKVFSAVGVVFKGSGFYRTDSRSSSSASTGSSSGNGSSSSSGDTSKAAASTSSGASGSDGSSSSSGDSSSKSTASSGAASSGSSAA